MSALLTIYPSDSYLFDQCEFLKIKSLIELLFWTKNHIRYFGDHQYMN